VRVCVIEGYENMLTLLRIVYSKNCFNDTSITASVGTEEETAGGI
jgi:hypothetical protein